MISMLRNAPRRRCAVVALLVLTMTAPARAQDSGPDAARLLERRLRDWLVAMIGPGVDPGERPVRVEPSEGGFLVTAPLGALPRLRIDAEPLTATVAPLEGGRWRIVSARLPSPMTMYLPDGTGAGSSQTTLTVREQDHGGVLDPTLASPSHFESVLQGYAVVQSTAQGTQRTDTERIANQFTLRPAGSGRVDLLMTGEQSLIATNLSAKDVGPVSLSVGQAQGALRLLGVAPDQVPPVVRAVVQLMPLVWDAAEQARGDAAPPGRGKPAPSGTTPPLTPAQRTTLRAALIALGNVATSFSEGVTLQDIRLHTAGFSGHLDRLGLGISLDAPDGRLAFRLRWEMDGLDTPDLEDAALREFLPRHLLLALRFGGVPVGELLPLLVQAVDSDRKDPALAARLEKLLRKGPFVAGLDDFALELGPSRFAGHGEVQVLDKATYGGQAQLTATGLDALIARVNEVAALQQAAPALLLLKGLGRQSGDSTVWDVQWRAGKVLVNGNDVSKMLAPR